MDADAVCRSWLYRWGYLPPLFQRWFGVNLIVSRKMVVTLGAVLMIGPGMIGLFTSPFVAIALLCVGGFAHQALSGALITLSSDVFGRNEVATANGMTGMAAWLASTMFALVVGALADTIGFSPLFAVLAVFDVLGAVVIWTVLKINRRMTTRHRWKRVNPPRKARGTRVIPSESRLD